MKPLIKDMINKCRKNRTIDKYVGFFNTLKFAASGEYQYLDGTKWAPYLNLFLRFS